jgi:hypothetical protein
VQANRIAGDIVRGAASPDLDPRVFRCTAAESPPFNSSDKFIP